MALDWYWYIIILAGVGVIAILLLGCNFPWNKTKWHCIKQEAARQVEEERRRMKVIPIAQQSQQISIGREEILKMLGSEEPEKQEFTKDYTEVDEKIQRVRDILRFSLDSED